MVALSSFHVKIMKRSSVNIPAYMDSKLIIEENFFFSYFPTSIGKWHPISNWKL
jgi:hypothetical protein